MRIAITVLTLILLASQVYGYRLWGEFSTGRAIGPESGNVRNLGFAEITMHLAQPILGVTPEIYGGWRTWFSSERSSPVSQGYPFQDIYFLGSRVEYMGIFVDVMHYCNHRVISSDRDGNAIRWNNDYYGENLTTISIGVKFDVVR